MTHSIFNDIILLKDKPFEDIVSYFDRINVHIFHDIIRGIGSSAEKKNSILFVICAFSEDSPMVVARQDRHEELEQVCEYLQIPEYQRQRLTRLTDDVVRKAATQYLTQFAGEDFRTLMFLKIQLEHLELMITNRDFALPGTDEKTFIYDIKEHGKATAERDRLSKLIVARENEMRAKVRRIGIDRVNDWLKEGKKKTGSTRSGEVGRLIEK